MQHDSHKFYRALLHLYPKSHRKAYGEQMVQTLDDILLDQPTKRDRTAVWLKVLFELPINALEENFNSIGEISVNKLTKITAKQYLYGTAGLLIIGSYLVLGFLWQHQRSQVATLNQELQTVTDNQFAMSGGQYYDVTIAPSENTVYLPLAKLKLPDTTVNQTLVYTYAGDKLIPGSKKVDPAQVSISTHDLAINNFSSTRQFDCTQVVYGDFASPSYPVNPKWKSNGNVKLADGRTMNIYYAPSIPGCDDTWKMLGVDSKAIADSLKQAVSY